LDGEEENDFRGRWNLKQPIAHTTLTSMCVSVCGVKQWNNFTDDIRKYKSGAIFKKEFKNTTLEKYRVDGIDKA